MEVDELSSPELRVSVEDRVMTVLLNRPEKHNAFTGAMRAGILAAVAEGDRRDDVGCIVLKGAGPSFCSGFDFTEERGLTDEPGYLNDYDRTIQQDIRSLRGNSMFGPTFWYSQTPVVAQVRGYCLAGGLEIACNCDLIVASTDARFGYPIVRNMASPPSHMFTYLMGTQWTRYLLYTGDMIDGATAAAIGLALWAAPPDELDGRVAALAERIATVPAELLAVNKSICEKALDAMGRPLLQHLAIEADAVAHKTPTMKEFFEVGKQAGYKAGLRAVGGDQA
jgi:enoyl-CoA hydratase